jgi:hypothetical protein
MGLPLLCLLLEERQRARGTRAGLARATSPAQADERAGCELLDRGLEVLASRLQPFRAG